MKFLKSLFNLVTKGLSKPVPAPVSVPVRDSDGVLDTRVQEAEVLAVRAGFSEQEPKVNISLSGGAGAPVSAQGAADGASSGGAQHESDRDSALILAAGAAVLDLDL